jgi:hypothetical protein
VAYDSEEVAQLELILHSGPTLVLRARDDLGTPYETTAVPLSPGWNKVALSWQASPTAQISLAVNDGADVELPVIDTEHARIDTVRWGVVGGTLAASAGTLAMDQFASWR